MGKGGSSSSQANQTSTVQSFDNRIVTESGIVATGGATINAQIEHLDGDIVKQALDFAMANSDDVAGLYGKLIEFGSTLFDSGAKMLQTGQIGRAHV